MKYNRLGKSDLEISEIGFGCMSLKGNQSDVDRLMSTAVENGINFFDTADLYDKGDNERLVGKALQKFRGKVVLATKVGNQMRSDGNGWDWNPSRSYIIKAVEDSLTRLQIGQIDLYQLHGGTIEDTIDETIDAFETLKAQGKIRNYGISSIRPNVIRRYVEQSNIVSVMMQYSLLDRRPEEEAFPLLQNNNIGVLARGTVAGGLLVNKAAKQYLNYSEEQVKDAANAIKQTSSTERNNAQTAIQFALQQPAITSAIVGIRTLEHLHEAIGAANAPQLMPGETTLLRQTLEANKYEQHR